MEKDRDILLLGKTGAGKSATGNSILRRKAFPSIPSTSSVTIKSRKEITQLKDGRKLRVVDTPGLLDTRGTKSEGEELFMKAIKEAIVMNPKGYHVFILTFAFGRRFTHEDLSTMNFLKELFGDNFVKTYCIIIITNGDCFQTMKDNKVIEGSFLDWCRQQEGQFKELLDEVNERIVLFNNYGNEDVMAAQLEELLKMIDEKMLTGRRFINTKFEKALKMNKKFVDEPGNSFVPEPLQETTSLILLEISQIKQLSNIDIKISKFKELTKQIEKHLKDVDEENNKNNAMEELRKIVLQAKAQIDQELISLKPEKEAKRAEFQKLQTALKDNMEKHKQHQQGEQQQQQQLLQTDQQEKELIQKYLNHRDESNNNRAMCLLDVLAWPFKKISEWFSPK